MNASQIHEAQSYVCKNMQSGVGTPVWLKRRVRLVKTCSPDQEGAATLENHQTTTSIRASSPAPAHHVQQPGPKSTSPTTALLSSPPTWAERAKLVVAKPGLAPAKSTSTKSPVPWLCDWPRSSILSATKALEIVHSKGQSALQQVNWILANPTQAQDLQTLAICHAGGAGLQVGIVLACAVTEEQQKALKARKEWLRLTGDNGGPYAHLWRRA